MTPRKPSDYVPAPSVPTELERRYQLVLGALTGAWTVADAARQLGMSRNRFQTIMHRGARAMLEAIQPQLAGRPPKAEREVELERQVRVLEKQNSSLRSDLEMTTRLFSVASEVLKGRTRQSRTKATKKDAGHDDTEDASATLVLVRAMRQHGIPASHAARAIGRSATTVHRQWRRHVAGEPLRRPRGPRPGPRPPGPESRQNVEALLRATNGLIGADALSHAVPATSRRQCAYIKAELLARLELERRTAASRVRVLQPGVVRGFDAMHLPNGYLLIAADGAIPYRTTIARAETYDGQSVAQVLEDDFARHGAPLVWRRDRAKCHTAPEVEGVLRRHKVLSLVGPAHYPRFYGQLERQNLEHRAWLKAAPSSSTEPVSGEHMREIFNERWPRRTLGWQTAGQRWRSRRPLRVDRDELAAEVSERTVRLRLAAACSKDDVLERIAIQVALQNRGLLALQSGTRC